MEFLVNCLAAGPSLGEIIVKMFIQRLITFTLIVFCSVLLSVENVCLSEVCDHRVSLATPLLSVHNYNQFFIKTKQEGATGDNRDTRGS